MPQWNSNPTDAEARLAANSLQKAASHLIARCASESPEESGNDWCAAVDEVRRALQIIWPRLRIVDGNWSQEPEPKLSQTVRKAIDRK